MAKTDTGNLKKKRREDLLLMIRELVEENESLRRLLSEAQAKPTEEPATGLDGLRAGVDACTSAILTLTKVLTEYKR